MFGEYRKKSRGSPRGGPQAVSMILSMVLGAVLCFASTSLPAQAPASSPGQEQGRGADPLETSAGPKSPIGVEAAVGTQDERPGYGPLGEILPDIFFEARLFEIQLWQWIGLLLLVPIAFVVSWIAAWILYRTLRPLAERTATDIDDRLFAAMLAPIRLLLVVAAFAVGVLLLRLSVPVQRFITNLELALAVVAVTWAVLRLVDILAALTEVRLESRGRRAAIAVVPLGRRTAKVVIVAVALIAALQNLGFQVTGLIAGLGVGGLAIALAAQKTLEQVFGGVSLIADQPVRVGDFCRFGDKLGIVEDVGLRSTRVRTLDRTVVSIPNAEFSSMQLENFAKRDRIRLYTRLGLRYETTADQLRYVLVELRKLLVSHPKVAPDPCRIRFVGYGDYTLDLEVFAYILTADYNEFLAIQEDILLRMMDTVQQSGSGFAFPSQTLYMARDDGLDQQRSEEAMQQVRTWRDQGRLPFPNFSRETLAELDGTLDFPPKGAVPLDA